MFLFCCFLLLLVFIFAWYLSLCFYPHLSKASWDGVTESSAEDNDESRDSIEIGKLLNYRWCVVRFSIYYILYDYFLFGMGNKLNLSVASNQFAIIIVHWIAISSSIFWNTFWKSYLSFSYFWPLMFLKIAKPSSQ